MASEDILNNSGKDRPKWFYVIAGAVGFVVLLILFVWVFATPSSDEVFKDMNAKMLQIKAVTIDQTMTLSGTDSSGDISSKIYLNMSDNSDLKASGAFTMTIENNGTPILVAGDVLKIGDSNFVKYSKLSSTSADAAASFAAIEAKLKGGWIKTRSVDQFSSLANSPVEFAVNILPTPFANLTNDQRDKVVKLLSDDSMYKIDESAKVDINGTSAYKYSITYDKAQYKKVAAAINGYQSYLTYSKDDSDSKIKTLTVWVDIDTKQIIKIEYTGTSSQGDVVGKMEFSGYDRVKSIDKPNDYSIESELLN